MTNQTARSTIDPIKANMESIVSDSSGSSNQFILTTTLGEIKSFGPCKNGLERFTQYWGEDCTMEIPITSLIKSNTFSDICWLIGKREVEIKIAVRAARLCADSIKQLKNANASDYADYAASAASDYATATGYATADYASAVDYASAANDSAAEYAASADYATRTYAANYKKQIQLNLSFLVQAIEEYQQGKL